MDDRLPIPQDRFSFHWPAALHALRRRDDKDRSLPQIVDRERFDHDHCYGRDSQWLYREHILGLTRADLDPRFVLQDAPLCELWSQPLQ